MSSDKPSGKKDELLRLLTQVEPQAENLEKLGNEIVGAARFVRDLAKPTRELLSRLPETALSETGLERELQGLRALSNAANEILTIRPEIDRFVAASSGSTITAVNILTMAELSNFPQESTPELREFKADLYRVLERAPLVKQARASMGRLRLDNSARNGRKTPLEHLDDAQQALEHPRGEDGNPISVLIPIRECIHAALAALLPRRPCQEPATKFRDKIASLGRQVARSGLQADHFDRLIADAELLMRDLHAAKQGALSREDQTETFHRAILLVNALLDAFDETKLKAP